MPPGGPALPVREAEREAGMRRIQLTTVDTHSDRRAQTVRALDLDRYGYEALRSCFHHGTPVPIEGISCLIVEWHDEGEYLPDGSLLTHPPEGAD